MDSTLENIEVVIHIPAKQKTTGQQGKRVKRSQRYAKSIREGFKNPTRKRKFRCSHCGRYFRSLQEINMHYSAKGHPKKTRPPKKLKLGSDFPPEKVETAKAIINMLENPHLIRQIVQEHIKKKGLRWSLSGID